MGGGVLGHLLAHISRLVLGAQQCIVSLLWLSHCVRFDFSPLPASQRKHAGTSRRGHSLESAAPLGGSVT